MPGLAQTYAGRVVLEAAQQLHEVTYIYAEEPPAREGWDGVPIGEASVWFPANGRRLLAAVRRNRRATNTLWESDGLFWGADLELLDSPARPGPGVLAVPLGGGLHLRVSVYRAG